MSIKLPEYVHFTSDLKCSLSDVIKDLCPDKIAILVDENTKEHCLPRIQISYDLLIEISSGEIYKNLNTCCQIWNDLTRHAFTRSSLLINLGGGVIGDMGGFAAATYKRGISFINIPTTLLSQVDASIGGKLGLDFEGLKNHIGVFQNPNAVIVDPALLQTLPKRELVSGYAEVVKHALISDADHWDYLINTEFDQLDWREVIPKSVAIKNKVVLSDPLEKGLRKILNFGHTLGHAIESHLLETDNRLLHGEAIAVGMILEGHLSMQLGMISESDFFAIEDHIRSRFSLPDKIPAYSDLIDLLHQDKKNVNSEISFSLLEKIGQCTYDKTVSTAQIINSMEAYR